MAAGSQDGNLRFGKILCNSALFDSQFDITWPAKQEHLAVIILDSWVGERVLEICYFCNSMFDFPEDAVAQFLDANNSLSRLLDFPKRLANPWRPLSPTLTTKSIIICRYRPVTGPHAREVVLKNLSGVEIMSLIGWGDSMWAQDTPAKFKADQKFLTALGGNAFLRSRSGP